MGTRKIGERGMTKPGLIAIAAVVALSVTAPVVAGKSEEASGVNVYNYETDVLDLDEGHSFRLLRLEGVQIEDGSGNLRAIRCYGTSEAFADGSTMSGGQCVTADPNGDKMFFRWQRDRTKRGEPVAGRYIFTGGTGKWTGLSGGGEYVYTGLALPPDGKGVSRWRVTRELP
jgi:hypothetical protein